jgi:hypothetical protein
MDISFKLEGIEETMSRFDPKTARTAAMRALNKIGDQTKTAASKIIREEYNIKSGDLNKFLRITARATSDSLVVVISAKGYGLALSYFAARQSRVKITSTGKGKGKTRSVTRKQGARPGPVTVQVKTMGGRKVVNTDPKPFIAQVKSGHIGVWKRIPGTQMASAPQSKRLGRQVKREMIEELYGPGVGTLFASRKVMTAVKKFINEKFQEIFQHELDYLIKK